MLARTVAAASPRRPPWRRLGPFVAAVAAGLWADCHLAPPPPPPSARGRRVVAADEAGRLALGISPCGPRPLHTRRLLGGRLAPIDTRVAHVFSPVAGRVESLDAAVGARVGRGDLLARIVSADVAAAASDLRRTRAELRLASRTLARERALSALGATSLQAVEGARDRLQVAVAEEERAGAMASLLGTQAGGEAARILRLTSPIAGEVIARGSNLGVTVQGVFAGGLGAELFTIADLTRIWVELDLHAVDVGVVAEGAHVEVWPLADAPRPEPLARGRLHWVSRTLDPVRHTGQALMEIDNPNGELHPFMPVRAHVEVAGITALAVARRAVAQVGGKTVVWVRSAAAGPAAAWSLALRPVQVDLVAPGEWVEVLHGLAAGEEVVVGDAADWAMRLAAAP